MIKDLSPESQLALVSGFVALMTTVIGALLAWIKIAIERVIKKATEAADEAKVVKETLAESTANRDTQLQQIKEVAQETQSVARETKSMMNGEKLNLLEAYYKLAVRYAAITHQQVDQAEANFAERRYLEHLASLKGPSK
jgi:hypothetical protein